MPQDGRDNARRQSRHRGPDRHHAPDGRRRNEARHRRRRHRVSGLARENGQGAQRDPSQVVRIDARQQRRPGADPDQRTRQAARGVERRDRDRRGLHRVVRRGSETGLRRRDTDDRQRSPAGGGQGTRRGLRGDHAMEFSLVDDHPQGRTGARGGVHGRHQAGASYTLLGIGARRARPSRGLPAGRAQRHHGRRARDRRRNVRESHGAQAVVHRLDRDRPAADEAGGPDGQEDLARARGQCAVRRVRRCRSRRRGRWRDHRQVSQRRTDVRVHQPVLRAREASTTLSRRSSSSA